MYIKRKEGFQPWGCGCDGLRGARRPLCREQHSLPGATQELCPRGLLLGVELPLASRSALPARLLLPRRLMQLTAPTVPRPPGMASPPFGTTCHPVLTRRASDTTYLPSVAVGWDWVGVFWHTEPGLGGLTSKSKEVAGSFWKSLSPSSADGDHSYSQESQPKSVPAWELLTPLQSLDLEREQESRGVAGGICTDKVRSRQRPRGSSTSCSPARRPTAWGAGALAEGLTALPSGLH